MAFALFRRNRTDNGTTDHGLLPPIAEGAGLISCQVLDPTGRPMGGAEVTVSDARTHLTQVRAISDPYGTFLATLPPGHYSVMISADGMRPYRGTVEIAEGLQSPIGAVR